MEKTCNFAVITLLADGLALFRARSSANTVMTKLGLMYIGLAPARLTKTTLCAVCVITYRNIKWGNMTSQYMLVPKGHPCRLTYMATYIVLWQYGAAEENDHTGGLQELHACVKWIWGQLWLYSPHPTLRSSLIYPRDHGHLTLCQDNISKDLIVDVNNVIS